METKSQKACLFCHRGEEATPLVNLSFRGAELWICPQHLPLLIHKPTQLVGLLPGAENLSAFTEEE